MNAETEKHTRGPDAGVTRHSISGEMKESADHLLFHALSVRREVCVCDVNRTAAGANVCWVTAGRRQTRLV